MFPLAPFSSSARACVEPLAAAASRRNPPAGALSDRVPRQPPTPPHLRVEHSRAGTFLYVDGSCASFVRRGRATTGGSWDLLAAPVLLVAPARPPRVLLLGVGAGTVIRILRALRPEAEIVALDNDAAVLAVARRRFALDALGATVHCVDARRFVAGLRPAQRFDLIIDDIYAGAGDALHKPAGWDATLRRARARLRPGGLLICNALDAADARALRAVLQPHALLTHADYYNHFLLAGRAPRLSPRAIGRRLRRAPLLAEAMQRTRVHGL